ncbi:MAG TPA: energy transducer TonB [Bacteroidota bacterium]
MTTTPSSESRARYGAIELKDSIRLYWTMGLGLAVAIHLAVIGSYKLAGAPGAGAPPGSFTKPGILFWLPPPPLNPGSPAPINIAEPGIKNSVGTPVPIEDGIADPEQTLAPQHLFNPQTSPVPGGTEGEWREEAPIVIPETEPPPFQIVEEMPKVVRSVAPVYPELAIRSDLTGTVYVKIWVDKEGKPREVSVVRSDAEMLNEAAIAAAKQFLFTPAYMNSGPVSVWVTIPFRFRLAERN